MTISQSKVFLPFSGVVLLMVMVTVLIGVVPSAFGDDSVEEVLEEEREERRLEEVSIEELSDSASHLSSEMAKSLQGRGSDRLQAMRERAFQLQDYKAEFLKRVAAGEVDLYQDLKADLERIGPQLAELQRVQADLSDPEISDSERERLSKVLFAGLQPIGPFLDNTSSIPLSEEDSVLKPNELAELKRLDQLWRGPGPSEEGDDADDGKGGGVSHFKPLSPTRSYTMHFLSVPLAVSTEPGTKVYWAAENGGRFQEGNISLYESVADKNGVATATWIGKGGAEGVADVIVSTPDYHQPLHLEVQVVDLRPLPLPSIPDRLEP